MSRARRRVPCEKPEPVNHVDRAVIGLPADTWAVTAGLQRPFNNEEISSMRQGQQGKRMRGRNRKGPNPLTRSYESNGGDVKIRGTAVHVAEKYVQLARDAHASDDRVASEHYFQHAEHYFRIVAAGAGAQQQQQAAARMEAAGETSGDGRANGGNFQSAQPANKPTIGPDDPQPFAGGNGTGAGESKPQDVAPIGVEAPLPPTLRGGASRGNGGRSRQSAGADRTGPARPPPTPTLS